MYLIKRKDKFFTHVGLLINEDIILHYASKTNNMFSKNQEVRVSNLKEFSNGRKVFWSELNENIDYTVLQQNANSFKSNGKKYNFLTNNCIPFILSCLNGKNTISIFEMIKGMIKYKIVPLSFILN